VLVTRVEVYEQKHYRIDPPDPIEAIKFRMEQLELKPSDLAEILGGPSVGNSQQKKETDSGDDAIFAQTPGYPG
jgi:antitoxin component HigA of HigAB toxin-antitoxin module